jgi:Asp-tRNA(Asn)/Glu-tRNA(Gln) amidotransferase A subunit family amidase
LLLKVADSHSFLLHKSLMPFSGMNTTAGSFSLLGSVVPEDAGVVKRLRAAGAIILGTPIMTAKFSI